MAVDKYGHAVVSNICNYKSYGMGYLLKFIKGK